MTNHETTTPRHHRHGDPLCHCSRPVLYRGFILTQNTHMNAAEFLERFNDWIDSITDEELLDRLKNMKDKPPTTVSLNTARKIAERMREQYPAALPALPAQTDYERGFTDGHETGYQAGLRKAADELNKP